MNYKKIYDALVEKAKVRGLDKTEIEGYFEKHHILPRCQGGTDDQENLVLLTAREHYIAHILLWKIYPSDSNLFHAAWMMSNRSLQNRNSRVYAMLREEHARILSSRSEFNSPNFKDLTGLVRDRLTVIEFAGWSDPIKGKRTSLWSCQCECGEVIVLKSRELSENWHYKSCGCFKRDQQKERTGEKNAFFGKKHSEESKEKMRQKRLGKPPATKGRPVSEETRARIISSLSLIKRLPWEHNSSTQDKWCLADYFYELYLVNTELTKFQFATMYNKTHNDSVGMHYFVPLVERFKSGWIPQEDSDWLEFKNNFVGEIND
ncbi:NUMOD3 motif (2 copies) [compost metagenome]